MGQHGRGGLGFLVLWGPIPTLMVPRYGIVSELWGVWGMGGAGVESRGPSGVY